MPIMAIYRSAGVTAQDYANFRAELPLSPAPAEGIFWSMPHCTVDLRVGGRYRYVWRNDETGAQFGSYGEHLEVVPVQRIVTTENMDGLDGQPLSLEPPWGSQEPSVNTLTLAEAGGRTTLTINARFPSKEIRDMAVQSGMTDGMAVGYDRLEAMAAELSAG